MSEAQDTPEVIEPEVIEPEVIEPEVIEIDSETVSCDGGGALGHPRVWLNTGGKGTVDCPYCDRQYVLKPGAKGASGH